MAKGAKKRRTMPVVSKPKRIRVLLLENGKKRFIWRDVEKKE